MHPVLRGSAHNQAVRYMYQTCWEDVGALDRLAIVRAPWGTVHNPLVQHLYLVCKSDYYSIPCKGRVSKGSAFFIGYLF